MQVIRKILSSEGRCSWRSNLHRWAPGRGVGLLLWLGLQVSMTGALADTGDFVKQGQRAFEQGAFSQAAGYWEKAIESFRKQGDSRSEVHTAISLASAYQGIGEQRRALKLLQESLDRAERNGDRAGANLVRSRLGAAMLLVLENEKAVALLQQSLSEATAAGDSNLASAVLNDLGNAFAAQQLFKEALSSFEQSVTLAQQASNSLRCAQALCNAASTAVRAGDQGKAAAWNDRARQETQHLETTHEKVFLLLTIGLTDRQIRPPTAEGQVTSRRQAQEAFRQALELAEQLKDLSGESYALGYLSQLYEEDHQIEAALGLARRAAFTAQLAQMPEALYQWEWQTARLLKKQGDKEAAIAAYRRAVQALQPIRNDVSLGYGNATARLPFRQAEGPLFFELADLLLEQAKSTPEPARAKDLLLQARDTVEQLKAVELEDYFHDDCVNTVKSKTRSIETVDPETAVIYLIPLPDRTEVLLSLAAGLQRFTLPVGSEALETEVRKLRRNLETRTTYGYLEQAQQLYSWLIRPLQPQLETNHIQTLVFVPDGALGTIPFSALHDGERFLVQHFAVAVAPGLSLVEPHPLNRGKERLLLNGLSDSVQGYPALSFVNGELQSIEPMYPSAVLENQGFTLSQVRHKLTEEQYSIVHIASHGKFDRDSHKTFVLTYDNKLTLNDLESLIRPAQYRGRPVELLVLSACQTAAGDDRAALGLAGVAVKAGARSALATLWFVNDQSTSALITEFYSQLRSTPTVSKARSLQLAQIKLLGDRRYRHPCYWSPYLIIGNWL